MTGKLVARSFFERDALDVARDLVGKHLRRDEVVLRLTEVEAYRWPDDSACHARSGRTARNAPMFGPAGHAYVFLCYGIHHMLNLVTDEIGHGAAVLIRSAEPVAGLETIRRRRGGRDGAVLLTGPGKIGRALDLDLGWNDHPVYEPGGLELFDAPSPSSLLSGPRVGIDYARPEHVYAPWRFAAGDTAWVTHRQHLRPARPRNR